MFRLSARLWSMPTFDTASDAAAVAAATTTAKPWYDGQPSDLVGYLENRGLKDKTVSEVALAAISAHRAAETLVGVPPNEIVRLPKNVNDTAAWDDVWKRLGFPGNAAGYDFKDVKKTDGTEPDPKLLDHVRATAHTLRMPKDAARALAIAMVKFNGDADAASLADTTAAYQAQRAMLQTNWGANWDVNMLRAKDAAARLGLSNDEIAALEKTTGYAKTMEMFRKIGAGMGEDTFKGGGGPSGDKVMTADGAKEHLEALKADKEWVKKYQSGDVAAHREMTNLLTIIHGDDTNTSRQRRH